MLAEKYDVIASLYNLMDAPFELLGYRHLRQDILPGIRHHKILEIGIGTGKNLPYYHPSNHITAIDISQNMIEQAKRKYRKLDPAPEMEIIHVQEDQGLPFPDNSFDTVVATFVIYLQENPQVLLEEIARVLQPGGDLRIAEFQTPKNTAAREMASLMSTFTEPLYGLDMANMTTVDRCRDQFNLVRHQQFWSNWLFTAVFTNGKV